MGHLHSPSGSQSSPKNPECPCQESNLVYDLRKVACESGTLQGRIVVQQPAEESDPVLQNRSLPCDPAHSQAVLSVARPGVEPGPTASEADMLSGTPTGHLVSTPAWNRTRTKTLGESCAVRYTTGTFSFCHQNDTRQSCSQRQRATIPRSEHKRADDWIRTSMIPLTRRTPF